jgi:hypothetical protein
MVTKVSEEYIIPVFKLDYAEHSRMCYSYRERKTGVIEADDNQSE